MMSVPAAGVDPRTAPAGLPRGYGWEGGSGTAWRTDPETGLTSILLTQRMMTSPEPPEVARDFWTAAYAAHRGLGVLRTAARLSAASKARPTSVTDGPGLNRPVVPLPAEVGRANQA